MKDVEYRDYVISHTPQPYTRGLFGFQFTYKDYDGPEDSRIGSAESVDDAKNQIDVIYIEEEFVQ